ncbi:MAG: hypothetical protein NC432_06760 [Roseburia sp.]|nr:hypothetical protein [Roseburia sp.]MCM1097708.1 hypothetical protein [Ruminococcus flavefaciens]MCM1219486.1 hypothetical protein [Lachnospiraceae bacterium]
MAGISVREIKNVEITTTDGKKIKRDDLIVICIKGQDIVCRFIELDKNSYFVTKPLVAGQEPIKYRISSIDFCYKVKAFDVEIDGVVAKEAGADAADHADQDTLAPAAE